MAVGAKVRVDLSGNKTLIGTVVKVSSRGVLISKPKIKGKPTLDENSSEETKELSEQFDDMMDILLLSPSGKKPPDEIKEYEVYPTIDTFIPWTSVESVRILAPARKE